MNEKGNHPRAFAAKHADNKKRAISQSGGMFVAISDVILSEGGAVYGCIYDEHFKAIHSRATQETERDRMCGSKYVQSDLGATFRNIRMDLDKGQKVLFSGTPCQVDGLRSFLRRDYENLWCVDLVCYGVNSPLIWAKNLEMIEKKNKGEIVSLIMRDKSFGWHSHKESYVLQMESNKEITVHSEMYRDVFSRKVSLRQSCHVCPYKNDMRKGDLTIGDCWGLEKTMPEFVDEQGVSLVLVNTAKGEELFCKMQGSIEAHEIPLESCKQESLLAPFPASPQRGKFWGDFFQNGYEHAAKRYGRKRKSPLKKIKKILKRK